MSDDIYLIQDGKLVEMSASAYDSEALLQQLLAEYPNLLAGAQVDPVAPRRWLLVSREVGVPSQESGVNRWSIDHLFLDQDGVPTLVEVKRSSDTRIRREVVGQLLDYAANAVVYWPVEEIRSRFNARCERQGIDEQAEIGRFLGPDGSPDAFWESVKTNLQAGKVRLLFVADVIPPELRRVVEFLNAQMDPAQVLALEITQYAGEGLKTLVPRVIGQTAEALSKKASSSGEQRQWDENSFFERITEQSGSEAARVARRLLDWAKTNAPIVWAWWGRGKRDGSFVPCVNGQSTYHQMFAVWTYGRIEIYFQYLKTKPPFEDYAKRKELLDRVNEITGASFGEDAITRRPSIPLSMLSTANKMAQFLNVLDWVINEIRNPSGMQT